MGIMKTDLEQFPAKNPNPVLSVANNCTVLYSNKAGEPLLHEWGVVVGEKLPSYLRDLVKSVITLNRPEKMELKIEKKVYLVAFHPSSEEKCVNIYGFDITDQKELEERLRIKEKQNDILYRIGKVALEFESLQIFLDESVKLIANILEVEYCKILELMPDGNFLLRAGSGWKHGLVGKAIIGGEKESQAGYTLFSGMPVVVEDFAGESRFKKPEILRMHEVNSGVSVTIGSIGKIFGVLGVHSRKKRKFTSDDTYFLSSVAFLIAQVIERKKAEEALKEAHDSLEETVTERTSELEKSYISLKESESRLAEAQRMAHIGSWDWNLITGEVCWSDELYHIFGRSPQESGATYDEFLSYVHPDDRDRVDNALKKGLNGESVAGNYRIILGDGEERIVRTEAEVVFDEKNNPVQVKGTVQDITEIKKVEEQLKILANIVESSNDAIGTISLDGNITGWNQEAENVYGYSVGEVLGKPVSIVTPPHLDKETIKLIEEIMHGKKVQHYETLRLRKDGTTIYVSITLSPVFDSYGKLIAISFISRDITERKKIEEKLRESEEKYRNIVETANEGISIVDAEERITFVNKKIEDMFGYSSEELIGGSMWDLLSDESKTIIKQMLEKGWKNVNESFEIKFIHKDGYPVWTYTNSKSLFDKDGKFFGTMNLHTDITKRKEAEEALRNFEIARKKEIHHRIKNNLQVICSLLDLQAEKFRSRESAEDTEVLNAFIESQNRVMSIALIHEELHEGRGTDTLNFSPYLEKLVENLFQTYILENVNTSLDIKLEENIFFDMDTAIPLGIIVNELVSNSLKYAFSGRDYGEIQIKLYREDSAEHENKEQRVIKESYGGTNVILIVSDNGIGIPEDFNLEDSSSLGLQLVKILVDQLEGQIELNRDSGTEFTIRFTVQI
ncbi:sensory transduction histidine kinase [Methanosarcina mazei WWM610]|jgi:PAS domain S-box-containing protein|uniref:Sensory transduction histidine kinase n=5 Tax=Methanosarcina mazei TaxID=2209 RepID=A0A0E3PWS4_METMZ|nr:sensory transduction histidine kinase [Methanosarcina mazei WWM610]AKB70657.1 sensory transduction histidine kinase [Methanosarcina mazei C16]UWJ22138.1 sensory transduction histidine kinase [Methanosarcina mazei TMA]BBL63139.1 histidine kinase [Methanosarcina mazei]